MSELVPREMIEQIVGADRNDTFHVARAEGGTVYILHSQSCVDSGIDLRRCPFSASMDLGIYEDVWEDWMDQPVFIEISAATGRLTPTRKVPA